MTAEPTYPPSTDLPNFVVGIGSSAGGLEALRPLLRSLDASAKLAIVIAQHLSPQHETLLTTLLGRETDMKVITVDDGTTLTAHTIYVTPPNADVVVEGPYLRLYNPPPGHGPKPSVNRLLQSLGQSYGERSIGVVLSGTGSDGANGMRSLKAAEGVTIVQEPSSAKYDSMPLAAIKIGTADLILPPEGIGEELSRLSYLEPPLIPPDQQPLPQSLLERIVKHLAQITGFDFRNFKDSTLVRQVDRRMAVLRHHDRNTYLHYLEETPQEAWLLQKNLLVSVTQFFRDPAAFETLAKLIAEFVKRQQGELRVWIAGCATGEEAYSIAIQIAIALGGPQHLRRLKVFATDIDDNALEEARRGIYHPTALEHLDQQLVQQYFNARPDGLRVVEALKEATVFARHNLETDPPFTRLDLISCRNTLIYFKQGLQEQVLRKFHYALREQGYLFLGSSETIGNFSQAFATVDNRHRLYQRLPQKDLRYTLAKPVDSLQTPPSRQPMAALPRRTEPSRYLQRFLQDVYAPPSLLLDDSLVVRETAGNIGLVCEIPQGQLRTGVFDLLRTPLQNEARLLLMRVRSADTLQYGRPVTVEGDDDQRRFRPVARRLINSSVGNGYVLSFEEQPLPAETIDTLPSSDDRHDEVQLLRAELTAHQENLQTSIEEVETANEELQAMNEELQAASEELQASNEELETTNEELQATNEELTTVNEELQVRTQELSVTNTDLENILHTISHGVIIVDNNLAIQRYSPDIQHLFGLMGNDIGRRLTEVPCHIAIDDLAARVQRVLDRGEREVDEFYHQQASYLLQIEPYQSDNLQRRGAIIAFSDTSELSQARQELAASAQRFRLITNALQEVVWIWSPDLRYLRYASPAYQRLTGEPPAPATTISTYHQRLVHAEDRGRVWSTLLEQRHRGWQLEYRIQRDDGNELWVQDTASPVGEPGDEHYCLVGSLVDVTTRKQAELRTQEAAIFYQTVLDNQLIGVAALDDQGCLVSCNQAFQRFLGHAETKLIGQPITTFIHPEDVDKDAKQRQALQDGDLDAYTLEKRYLHRDGDARWAEITVQRLAMPNPLGAGRLKLVKDISQQKQWQARLALQAATDTLTGLANRGRFLQELNRELATLSRNSRPLAILFLDLDGFKDINDTFGHGAGDRVLGEVANRLRYQTRSEDLIARLGGDEFALLMRNALDISSVSQRMERLLQILSQPVIVDGTPVRLSASIGVSIAPNDGNTADELLQKADTAMYASKRSGRDRFTFFAEDMNAELQRHLALKQAVQVILSERGFFPVFQPIYDLQHRQVVFVEALLRWEKSWLPHTSVQELVDFCEQSDAIIAVGQQIFEQSLQCLTQLRQHYGPAVRVSINLSVRQLEDAAFQNAIIHLSPPDAFQAVMVEITESLLLRPRGRAIETLEAFRRKGALLAIDDFGKGYSALGRLEMIRPDIIKLDGDLLPRDDQDKIRRSFCEAIVAVGRGIEARVVAEGVETEEHLAFVTELGCHYGQGYLLGRPSALATE